MKTDRLHVARVHAAAVAAAVALLAAHAPAKPTLHDPSGDVQRVEGGPIVIEQELDRSTMLAAEWLTVTWRVLSPVDVRVSLPPIPAPGAKAGDFSVVASVDEPATLEGTPPRLSMVRRLVLEPFLPGRYATPVLEAAWSRNESERGVARTSPTVVEVRSLLPAPTQGGASSDALDPGPLRDEHFAEASSGRWVLIPAAIVSGVALAVIAAWAAGRRRRPIERDPVDAAFALANAVRLNPGDPSSVRPSLDDLARSLRIALADRVSPRAAAMTGVEAAADGPVFGDERRGMLEAARPLLARIDERRFSSDPCSMDALESLRRDVVDMVARLHAMPRHDAKGAR
ncbi:MAG: hypothetical protein WCK33_08570 [Phycisphaerae bacterium]